MIYLYAATGLIAFSLLIQLLQSLALALVLRRERRSGDYAPPVSILKPLKGVDDELEANLESFCGLDYPEYQLILSAQDEDDPALVVARRIRDRHPQLDIEVVCNSERRGLNPKVSNLLSCTGHAKHDIILVSDSNVRVRPSYLAETVSKLEEEEVMLVSNVIRGTGERSFSAGLENLHLNTFVAGNVTFLHAIVGRQCVVGKSMMMRRETLELLGGFESYKDVLAEDYLIGRDLSRQGRKVALSNHVVDNVNTHFSMSQFINRQVRWSKLRYRLAGPAYGFEFLSNPVLLATLMLPASATNHLFAVLWAATCMLKVCADIHKGYIMGSRMRYYRYLLSPVKDLMAGWFNVVPFFDRSVTWRGNRMRIGRDTRLDPEGSQSPDR